MEINNSNGSGSHKSACFQIFHLLTPPKSCCYGRLVPDSHVASPPFCCLGQTAQSYFFPLFVKYFLFWASSCNRLWKQVIPGKTPCLAVAACAGAAHATTHMDKINVGALQVKLCNNSTQPEVLIHLSKATCIPKPPWPWVWCW